MKKNLRVGIIGAGIIGGKRADAILATKQGAVIAVADANFARAQAFAKRYRIDVYRDWRELVGRGDIDVVIVAVPSAFAAQIAIGALEQGKHVLCEKPFGINARESRAILAAMAKRKRLVKVGFNHRFQKNVAKAKELFDRGAIGKLLWIRARYGHGGRPGLEKEWRMDPKIAGGGELLDQGAHVIDLARWFGGEFRMAYGLAQTKFWKAKVDDNAFAILANDRITAEFHVSTTQWKNLFSFELYGDRGYLEISGKGGGYGEQKLLWGKRNPGAAPDIQEFAFGRIDSSWEEEWKNFVRAIAKEGNIVGGSEDGLRANEIIEAIYASSRLHREIKMKHSLI